MKRLASLLGCAVELAILAGLFFTWGGSANHQPPSLRKLLPLLILYAIAVALHLVIFARSYDCRRALIRQSLLTGPCAFLTLFIVFGQTAELTMRPTKGLVEVAKIEGVPPNYFDEWYDVYLERIKFERLLYAMLLASTCLLYGSHYRAARRGVDAVANQCANPTTHGGDEKG
jgi:hypothetical protein